MSETDLIKQLEETGNYRVIKKLEPQEFYNADDGSDKKTAVFLDVETTGKDPEKDEIIELGMVAFEYNPDSGKIYRILEKFNELEEPTIEISEEASEVNGITMEMVKGHKINDSKVEEFISNASLILSHNAQFDRQFSEKRFPCFKNKYWGCSINDVSWADNGYKIKALEFLAYKYVYFFEGHRAYIDCMASIHLLSQTLPKNGNLVLQDLISNARKNTDRISANGAPFSIKDKLKARGYQWNGIAKFWYIDVTEEDTEPEIIWLKDNYNVNGQVISSFNAVKRYSNRI